MQYSLRSFAALGLSLFAFALGARAQTGNSGSIQGTVTDPSGGAIVGAKVEIVNVVSGYTRSTATGGDGTFRFANVPFNPYHMTVTIKMSKR